MERAEQKLVLDLSWQHMTNNIKKILTILSLLLVSNYAVAEITAAEILGTGKVINQFDQPFRRNGDLILIHKFTLITKAIFMNA